MKFFFRRKWKRGKKTYAEKLPWIAVQADLLEIREGGGRCSIRGGPDPEGVVGGGRCRGRAWALRVAQFALVAASAAAVGHVVLAALAPAAAPTPAPSASALLDLHDFRYVHEPREACDSRRRLFFVFLVHSRPDQFRRREAIRATWGGLEDLGGGWAARTVFMLGRGRGGGGEEEEEGAGAGVGAAEEVEALVGLEAEERGDLVVGSFFDHYRNLTYKHVMALRWASERCPDAAYVVKADDDAFVDVPALRALLGRTFGPPPAPRRTLACHALPPGTRPRRSGKWAVSASDYPRPDYPGYCAGLAYVASPDVARDLVGAAGAGAVPRIWVDDVWVTGLLAEPMRLRPHLLDLRYSYDHREVAAWAARAARAAPAPYIFAHLDPSSPDWRATLDALWSHALAASDASRTTSR